MTEPREWEKDPSTKQRTLVFKRLRRVYSWTEYTRFVFYEFRFLPEPTLSLLYRTMTHNLNKVEYLSLRRYSIQKS